MGQKRKSPRPKPRAFENLKNREDYFFFFFAVFFFAVFFLVAFFLVAIFIFPPLTCSSIHSTRAYSDNYLEFSLDQEEIA